MKICEVEERVTAYEDGRRGIERFLDDLQSVRDSDDTQSALCAALDIIDSQLDSDYAVLLQNKAMERQELDHWCEAG